MQRNLWICGLALALCSAPLTGIAKCNLKRVADLPIAEGDSRPVIEATVNGQPARFVLESGAFYSMLTPQAATQFDLRAKRAPADFQIDDPSGRASNQMVWVSHFVLHDRPVSNVAFLLGGAEPGFAGVIGQNMLQSFDAEYDLAHGTVKLYDSDACEQSNLAYWVQSGERFSAVQIAPADTWHPQTIVPAQVAGVPVRAMFDSGSPVSLLSLRVAAALGIRPGAAGVTDLGEIPAWGGKPVHAYLATVPSFKVGDEEIRGAKLRVADLGSLNADMLLGADFFRSHRIFVGTRERQVYLTYNGGPVFSPAQTTVAAAGP